MSRLNFPFDSGSRNQNDNSSLRSNAGAVFIPWRHDRLTHRKAGKKGSDGSPDSPPKRTIIRVAPVTAKG